MNENAAVLIKIVFAVLGIVTVVLGYLIRYKQKLTLIAGYKPQKVKDPAGLGRFVGLWVLVLGLILVAYPWLPGVQNTSEPVWSTLFFLPIGAIIIILIVGIRRYQR